MPPQLAPPEPTPGSSPHPALDTLQPDQAAFGRLFPTPMSVSPLPLAQGEYAASQPDPETIHEDGHNLATRAERDRDVTMRPPPAHVGPSSSPPSSPPPSVPEPHHRHHRHHHHHHHHHSHTHQNHQPSHTGASHPVSSDTPHPEPSNVSTRDDNPDPIPTKHHGRLYYPPTRVSVINQATTGVFAELQLPSSTHPAGQRREVREQEARDGNGAGSAFLRMMERNAEGKKRG